MDNKLIELLTEHCRKHYGFKDNDDIEIDTDSVCFHLYHKGKRCFSIRIETVICKDFGFIKWLVDNDYIDRDKIDKLELIPTLTYQNMIDDCVCGKSHWNPYTFVGDEDELLMLLAISDDTIELLISILK